MRKTIKRALRNILEGVIDDLIKELEKNNETIEEKTYTENEVTITCPCGHDLNLRINNHTPVAIRCPRCKKVFEAALEIRYDIREIR